MMKFAPALVCLAILPACLAPSASQSVDANRVVTDVLDDGETIKGRYDPAGFTQAEARKMAAFSCEKAALASYSEAPTDGQVVFQATCRNGTVHGAGSGANFTRTGPNSAKFAVVFSDNGRIAMAEGDFPL